MKKVLIDECLPARLRSWLTKVDATTVQRRGWTGVKNGALLRQADAEFDVFLTADKNLKYQQNLQGRTMAIIVLPTNDALEIQAILAQIQAAVDAATPGAFVEL